MLSSYEDLKIYRRGLLFLCCLHLFSDCGGVGAEGKCSGWSTESPPPQHGREPECPLPAALLHYTKSSGFQGTSMHYNCDVHFFFLFIVTCSILTYFLVFLTAETKKKTLSVVPRDAV